MTRYDCLTIVALACAAAGCGSNATNLFPGDGGDDASGDGSASGGGSSSGASGGTGGSSGGGFAPDGSVRVDCTAYGGSCASGATCCSGLCDTKTSTCASSITACAPATAACAGNTDCCSGACLNGHCGGVQCLSLGATCPAAGNACCTGNCTNGTCQSIVPGASCVSANNTCTGNGECCSGLCSNGRCALGASYCIQTGDICYRADDCCGGICSAPNNQAVSGTNPGVCSQPSSGGVNCTGVDGSLCPGGNCGQCCSRLCAPYGPTGVNICQPAQGCRVEGDLCRTASDCCGGPGTGALGVGEVHCSNEGTSAAVGVCITPLPDGGGVCVPEGDVCHYTASNYTCGVSSARSDCCGPQRPKFDACNLDPFGVPRCNPYTGVGGDGGIGCIAAGMACSSADECCNGDPCVPGPTGALECTASACRASGQSCTTNADCCAGLPCLAPPGSIQGTCTPVMPPVPPPPPPPDGGGAGTSSSGGATSSGGGASSGSTSTAGNSSSGGTSTGGSSSGGSTTGGSSTGGTTSGSSSGSSSSGGYAPDGGYTCALYGQQCTMAGQCCNSVPCTAGRCLYPVN